MIDNYDPRLYQLAMIREHEVAEGAERKRLLKDVPQVSGGAGALRAILKGVKGVAADLWLHCIHPGQIRKAQREVARLAAQ